MKKIGSYDTVNLGELCAQIDWLSADTMLTPRDIEDYPPEQMGYVDRINSDIAQFNDGVFHLKCAIMRYLMKDEDNE